MLYLDGLSGLFLEKIERRLHTFVYQRLPELVEPLDVLDLDAILQGNALDCVVGGKVVEDIRELLHVEVVLLERVGAAGRGGEQTTNMVGLGG